MKSLLMILIVLLLFPNLGDFLRNHRVFFYRTCNFIFISHLHWVPLSLELFPGIFCLFLEDTKSTVSFINQRFISQSPRYEQ